MEQEILQELEEGVQNSKKQLEYWRANRAHLLSKIEELNNELRSSENQMIAQITIAEKFEELLEKYKNKNP